MSLAVRALDPQDDWTFGRGTQDYLEENRAILQNIQTRCLSVLNDCFFATNEGIDWFNLLGSKERTQLIRDLSKVIVETMGVSRINRIDIITNNNTRRIRVEFNVSTVYSESVNGQVEGLL